MQEVVPVEEHHLWQAKLGHKLLHPFHNTTEYGLDAILRLGLVISRVDPADYNPSDYCDASSAQVDEILRLCLLTSRVDPANYIPLNRLVDSSAQEEEKGEERPEYEKCALCYGGAPPGDTERSCSLCGRVRPLVQCSVCGTERQRVYTENGKCIGRCEKEVPRKSTRSSAPDLDP